MWRRGGRSCGWTSQPPRRDMTGVQLLHMVGLGNEGFCAVVIWQAVVGAICIHFAGAGSLGIARQAE